MRFRFLLPLLLSLAMARGQEVVKTPPPVSPAVQAQADQLVQMLRDANDLLAKGNTDGALAKINAVLKVDPQSLAAYVLRGAIYSKQKQWDKAQGDYEAAHLINPHSAVVQFNLAEVHFAQKQFNQARTAFQALEADRTTDLGDLAAYKVFLCDLFAGDEGGCVQGTRRLQPDRLQRVLLLRQRGVGPLPSQDGRRAQLADLRQ